MISLYTLGVSLVHIRGRRGSVGGSWCPETALRHCAPTRAPPHAPPTNCSHPNARSQPPQTAMKESSDGPISLYLVFQEVMALVALRASKYLCAAVITYHPRTKYYIEVVKSYEDTYN
ncbi:hypothetical protein EVAR_2832_1 [Eumeta japonica]|uniref:Uncharacterized protein n=1 Tax=Eumeta variegata TaxID=151549 RepID=A0A4C1SZU2_EUMVA|nr:hypothetical protein EVAR_2832_1 [Eumeta japonica]